jgi:hypothetical protein
MAHTSLAWGSGYQIHHLLPMTASRFMGPAAEMRHGRLLSSRATMSKQV